MAPPSSKEALRRQKYDERIQTHKSTAAVHSGKSSQRLSLAGIVMKDARNSLVQNDKSMFKRVQSSHGYRAKSTMAKGERKSIVDNESTKGSSQARYKDKRCLSIRSGAFRV